MENYITFKYEESKIYILTALWTLGAIIGVSISAILSDPKLIGNRFTILG